MRKVNPAMARAPFGFPLIGTGAFYGASLFFCSLFLTGDHIIFAVTPLCKGNKCRQEQEKSACQPRQGGKTQRNQAEDYRGGLEDRLLTLGRGNLCSIARRLIAVQGLQKARGHLRFKGVQSLGGSFCCSWRHWPVSASSEGDLTISWIAVKNRSSMAKYWL